jgi:hypothetical protein
MKNFIFLLILSVFISGCEDVIDVEVPSETPRLVIDALIRVNENSPTTTVSIRALESASFFDELLPTRLTQISIINLDNSVSETLLETEPNSGVYEREVNTQFLITGDLLLQVEHKGKFYQARTKYVKTNSFNSIVQGDGNLFGEDETEVIVNFTDIPDEDNFYSIDFDFNEYIVTEDTFYRGQDFIFSFFYDDQLDVGQELSISILGIDETFYNYMDQLIVQSGDDFGPFATPVSTVRGNLINVINIDVIDSADNIGNPDDFALGYFAVCQTFTQTIVIEE